MLQVQPTDDGRVVIEFTDTPPSELPSVLVVSVTAPAGETVTVSEAAVDYCEEIGISHIVLFWIYSQTVTI